MARPKKPTKLKEASGSAKKNPGRINKNEPTDDRGVGPAPMHLDKDVREIWDELVENSCPGVLLQADRLALELLARLVFMMRHVPSDFNAPQMAQMNRLLSQIGMTPADRSKISVPPKPKANRFEGL